MSNINFYVNQGKKSSPHLYYNIIKKTFYQKLFSLFYLT